MWKVSESISGDGAKVGLESDLHMQLLETSNKSIRKKSEKRYKLKVTDTTVPFDPFASWNISFIDV